MKILLMFLVAINLFANDFRLNNWGDLSEEVLKIENLPSISYKENFKSKSFNTFKDDYIYNYSIDEYSFLDSLESLGEFRVTYSFLKNRLYKGTYTKELKENDKSNLSALAYNCRLILKGFVSNSIMKIHNLPQTDDFPETNDTSTAELNSKNPSHKETLDNPKNKQVNKSVRNNTVEKNLNQSSNNFS